MNKKLILGALSLFLLAGCSSTPTTEETTSDNSVETTTETGGTQSSAEITDDEGTTTKVDLSKEDGKVTSITINQIKEDGTDKKEAGSDYGMASASSINKEWDEQVKALEDFIVKNGVDAVKLDSDGYAENEDLKTSCTINLTDIMEAVDEANAK